MSFAISNCDVQLQNVISNVTARLNEQQQSNDLVRDQTVKAQNDINSKLDRLLLLNAANEQLVIDQQNKITFLEQALNQNTLAMSAINSNHSTEYDSIDTELTTIKANQITKADIDARLQKQLLGINTKLASKKDKKRVKKLSNGQKNITRLYLAD